jgi:hypothetical protein
MCDFSTDFIRNLSARIREIGGSNLFQIRIRRMRDESSSCALAMLTGFPVRFRINNRLRIRLSACASR